MHPLHTETMFLHTDMRLMRCCVSGWCEKRAQCVSKCNPNLWNSRHQDFGGRRRFARVAICDELEVVRVQKRLQHFRWFGRLVLVAPTTLVMWPSMALSCVADHPLVYAFVLLGRTTCSIYSRRPCRRHFWLTIRTITEMNCGRGDADSGGDEKTTIFHSMA